MKPLPPAALEFVTERRLATLTTPRADGTAHVVPVGFTWDETGADDGGPLARVTMQRTSRKARNVLESPGGLARVALCSFERAVWITLEGTASISDDTGEVAEAVRRYAQRYERTPQHNPDRVVLRVAVDRWMSSRSLKGEEASGT